jgi:hypothetical protein
MAMFNSKLLVITGGYISQQYVKKERGALISISG